MIKTRALRTRRETYSNRNNGLRNRGESINCKSEVGSCRKTTEISGQAFQNHDEHRSADERVFDPSNREVIGVHLRSQLTFDCLSQVKYQT